MACIYGRALLLEKKVEINPPRYMFLTTWQKKVKFQLQRDWIRDIATKTIARGIVFLT